MARTRGRLPALDDGSAGASGEVEEIEPGSQPLKTKKREAFAHEYQIDRNATQAAIRAGYTKNTAGSAGHEILNFPEVAARVQYLHKERMKRLQMDADEMLAEASRIARANIADFITIGADGLPAIDLSAATLDQLAAVSTVEVEQGNKALAEALSDGEDSAPQVLKVKLRMHDKLKALDLVGRHIQVGALREKSKVGVQVGNVRFVMEVNG